MTEQEYQTMLDAVGLIADEVKAEKITSFTLTKEEAEALKELPESMLEKVSEILSAYKTDALDIRRELVAKGLSRIAIHLPQLVKAFKIGYAHGGFAL